MNFVHPYFLFLEIIILVLAAAYMFAFRARRRALAAFGENELMERLSSAAPVWHILRATMVLAATACVIVALAQPQFGAKMVEAKQRGSDVLIAVDVSQSMLDEDIKPNRITRAKTLLADLVQQLGGNRVGIIAFAGVAFWQCPMTLDIASVNLFLDLMDTNLIPQGGTAIGSAVRLGVQGLSKAPARTKAIILLTDGEDHKSDPEGAAEIAAKEGVKIFAVGFGSATGEPIPLRDGQGVFTGYKKNKKGEVVMSKLDEKLLSSMAAATGGAYIRAQDGTIDTARLVDAINGLDKNKLSSRLNREYEDRYQYPLAMGCVFLVAALFLPEKKRRLQKLARGGQ
ncbi:MAG: VWA domain-containing protein [Elusimicrobia bacterium]|nr:VWA domain-containing protein [Elusimicrobiota bacterium]